MTRLKKKQKYGSLYYLAMWQGLRGEDLNIDTGEEPVVQCTGTMMTVVFTSDVKKLASVEAESDE
ncbi:MAG: hypothetical protein EXS05_15965 [Planctomycetaceae bacterium]|nr:hypothetical protein [Planctomycetaceae bacterium]